MWTPTALASEFRRYRRTVWRVVEAQHRISTNRLAGNLAEQQRLEELADAAKPDMPKAAQGLHYLLGSPFRYGHTVASRFRRANERPGIFYASEQERTAITETAYWRLKFFTRSPGFLPGNRTSEHLSFSVPLSVGRLLDTTKPPLDADKQRWTDPDDYSACQELAGNVREANGQAIRAQSARDPEGINIALFDPACFAQKTPDHGRNWHLRLEGERLTAIALFPHDEVLAFSPQQFGLPALG
ncbi:RES family NAD+ phosphorylase [Alteraurantiacibacter aquimixticola]|uniref:RES domain-containing protein n=1 Tax=Alteraurantiacibacter aquimixticola TaxID=2489173 RepID=A0A4T3F548_9SPHN|nr:RES family NAD+ phosphorylase [Alteraurantiacibacter aquimixticola]TIX51504.1 RES domain-containing protein [Alteraurantiacibacter aquimixticola]